MPSRRQLAGTNLISVNIMGRNSSRSVSAEQLMDFADENPDIIAGIESGLDTVLVLSGVTTRETMERYPYRPRLVLSGVGELPY